MGQKKINKQRGQRTTTLVEQNLRAVVGEVVHGGRDHCAGYQQMREDVSHHPGIFMLGVHHDVGCERSMINPRDTRISACIWTSCRTGLHVPSLLPARDDGGGV